MMIPIRDAFAIAVAATVLVGCSGAGGPGSAPADGSRPPARVADGILQIVPGIADGPGITIEDAVNQAGAGPFLVNGSLFVDEGDTVLLCSAIAESFPPQCGGTRLLVRDLDLSSIQALQEADGVRWAEQVQLLGTVALVEG